MVLAGLLRFPIEFVRVNDRVIGPLTVRRPEPPRLPFCMSRVPVVADPELKLVVPPPRIVLPETA